MVILNHQHYHGGSPCEECEKLPLQESHSVEIIETVGIDKSSIAPETPESDSDS